MGFYDFGLPQITNAWATFAALATIVFGALTMLSISPTCWFTGFYMICVGCCVLALEAPLLCKFSNYGTTLAEKGKILNYWHRSALYMGGSLIFFACIGLSSIIAFVLIFSVGVLNFALALGPKGADATPHQPLSENNDDTLVPNKNAEQV
eukprot:Nk52_evm63s270 gene=Nk52_evmTU63s270